MFCFYDDMGEMQKYDMLLTDVANGNKHAFKKMFLLYYPRLIRYASFFLNNPDEAEDLVQDAFIQIWQNRETINHEKSFSFFIFTLVRNRCLNSLKRKVVKNKLFVNQANAKTEELYHIGFESEDDFLSMKETLLIEIQKIIFKMPERCQIAFRLKWIEGKKNREIAEEMKISATMVDKHLAKGLKIARKNLAPDLFLFLLISKV